MYPVFSQIIVLPYSPRIQQQLRGASYYDLSRGTVYIIETRAAYSLHGAF